MTRPRRHARAELRRSGSAPGAGADPRAGRDLAAIDMAPRTRADARADIPLVREADGSLPRQAPQLEVAVHELADGLAQALVSAQRELDRYGSSLGAYLLEELDFTVPVRMRLDALGQVMTTLVDQPVKDVPTAQLRLRVRAAVGSESPPDVASPQALDELGVLDAAALKQLASYRIFSVDDLLRVARGAAGRNALGQIELGRPLDDVLAQLSVAALPVITPAARRALVRAGIKSTADLMARDPGALARLLSKTSGSPVTEAEVVTWQKEVGNYLGVPIPVRPSRPVKHAHG